MKFGDLKDRIQRNKNTFTNWRKDPRPILKVSDIDDLARALEVPPAALVSQPNGNSLGAADGQLFLPFGPEEGVASVELECTGGGLVIRKPVGRTQKHRYKEKINQREGA
ncbi:MAG: hypothetical protein WD696_01250 [Bryobacteraceae bacterium]